MRDNCYKLIQDANECEYFADIRMADTMRTCDLHSYFRRSGKFPMQIEKIKI